MVRPVVVAEVLVAVVVLLAAAVEAVAAAVEELREPRVVPRSSL